MKISSQRFGLSSIYDRDWRTYLKTDDIPIDLLAFGKLIFITDVFFSPQQRIFGIVRSFYAWSDLSFLAHYNVHFVMTLLQEALQKSPPTETGNTKFLEELILQIHHTFQSIDL